MTLDNFPTMNIKGGGGNIIHERFLLKLKANFTLPYHNFPSFQFLTFYSITTCTIITSQRKFHNLKRISFYSKRLFQTPILALDFSLLRTSLPSLLIFSCSGLPTAPNTYKYLSISRYLFSFHIMKAYYACNLQHTSANLNLLFSKVRLGYPNEIQTKLFIQMKLNYTFSIITRAIKGSENFTKVIWTDHFKTLFGILKDT